MCRVIPGNTDRGWESETGGKEASVWCVHEPIMVGHPTGKLRETGATQGNSEAFCMEGGGAGVLTHQHLSAIG